jgi:hypothetical protein
MNSRITFIFAVKDFVLVEQHYELTSTPELLTLAAYVSKDGLAAITVKRGPLDM